MVRFDGIHAFGYNSAGSEPIWMKFGAFWEHCLPLAWQILGAIYAEATARERGEFLFFCQVGKQCRTLQISSWPNFTKFTHKTWIGVTMNPFGADFQKFPI